MYLAKLKQGDRVLLDGALEKASLRFIINESGSADITIPVAALSGRRLPLQSDSSISDQVVYDIEIYSDGELIIQGIVDSIKLDLISSDLAYTLQCNAELSELARKRARSNASYQNQQLLGILIDLLKSAPTWRLGDISTFTDPAVVTTIDLRNEKHLLPQIKKAVESVPNTFYRYGGFIRGYHRLDVGQFDVQRFPTLAPDQISDLVQNIKYSTIVRKVEGYGGEITVAGVKRLINLDDALAADPTLATDPDFPIVTDNGAKVVDNTALSIGEESVERFTEIVPTTRDNPPAAEIEEAGLALYQRVKAYMMQRQQFETDWTASVTQLPNFLKVGDRVFLKSNANLGYYDPISGRQFIQPIGDVAQWFRVNGYTVAVDRNKVDYKLQISSNVRLASNDLVVDLYNSIEQPDTAAGISNSLTVGTYDVLSYTVPLGLSANTVNGEFGEYPGRLVEVPFGTIPMGATVVTLYDVPFSTTQDVTFRISAYPALPGTPLQVAVSYKKNWLPTYTVTIYALVEYT